MASRARREGAWLEDGMREKGRREAACTGSRVGLGDADFETGGPRADAGREPGAPREGV
jgi:hypothetical protein